MLEAQQSPFPNANKPAFELGKMHSIEFEEGSLEIDAPYEERIIPYERALKKLREGTSDTTGYAFCLIKLSWINIVHRRIDKAQQSLKELKEVITQYKIENNVLLGEALSIEAEISSLQNQLLKSIVLGDSALVVYLNGPYRNESLYVQIVKRKYLSYTDHPEDTDSMFKYLDIARILFENHSDKDPSRLSKIQHDYLYVCYGNAYSKLGDHAKARNYHYEAIRRMESDESPNPINYGLALFRLVVDYYFTQEHELAIEYSKKLIDFQKDHLAANSLEWVNIYNGLAVNYTAINKPDSALLYLEKCRELLEPVPGTEDLYSFILLNMGASYNSTEQYETARGLLQQALDMRQRKYGLKNAVNVNFYKYLYENASYSGKHDKGLQYLDSALQCFFPDLEESLSKAPNIKSENVAFDVLDIIALHTKQYLPAYKQNPDNVSYLHSLLDYARLLGDILNNKRNSFLEYESVLFNASTFKDTYEAGLEAIHLLHKQTGNDELLEDALNFMTTSKAMLFLRDLGEFGLLRNEAVPLDLKQEFVLARKKVNEIEGEIQKVMETSITSDTIAILNQQKFEWSERLALARNKLISDYWLQPDEQDLSSKMAKLREVHHIMSEKEVAIEYFVGREHIFALAVNNEKAVFHSVERDSVFNGTINSFTEAFTLDQASVNTNEQTFVNQGNYLYSQLLEPLFQRLGRQPKKLVLVTDDVLNALPFELLLTSNKANGGFKQLDYLLKELDVAYSFSSLQAGFKRKYGSGKGILAFGYTGEGVADERAELGDLPGAREEIDYLKGQYKGKYFLGKKGNKQRFLREASDYNIIHLALHGKADLNNRYNSALIFNGDEDYNFNSYDLYGIDFNTQLVVLSACESGRGKIDVGEGTFSVARGFASTGVPSVVTTLWKVNDLASAEVVKSFYKYLDEGLTKDAALRQAKLDYLDHTDNLTSHPYYWGSFVVMGDTSPIQISKASSFRWYWLLALVVVIFGVSRIGRQPSRKARA